MDLTIVHRMKSDHLPELPLTKDEYVPSNWIAIAADARHDDVRAAIRRYLEHELSGTSPGKSTYPETTLRNGKGRPSKVIWIPLEKTIVILTRYNSPQGLAARRFAEDCIRHFIELRKSNAAPPKIRKRLYDVVVGLEQVGVDLFGEPVMRPVLSKKKADQMSLEEILEYQRSHAIKQNLGSAKKLVELDKRLAVLKATKAKGQAPASLTA